jgi:asparagine synthase (glutamine-hydrolysing)
MCGFAGVVAWDEKYRVSRDTLEKMSARIAHRGPDGQGLYLNHEEGTMPDRPQVGLVHRRLAILDLDPRANQPFTDNQGRWIVFNGEIYNFRELRAELAKLKPEYAWRTTGDTEVLLVAYDVWGEKCVEHLNGMFAFAVWDEPRGSLFFARDRMGQKPLYVATPHCSSTLTAVAFASELGGLAPLPWLGRELETSALAEYLRWGTIGNEGTIYQGVEKLAAGMWRTFGTDEGAGGDYYFSPNQATFSDETTRELAIRAVRRQLVSDVPVGCFLSGGVDSSVITAAAKLAMPQGRVVTFAIGFEDARYDETKFAASVARHLGTEHHEFRVRPDAAADLPKLAAVFGEPFGDSSALPTHYLSRETRQYVKVALSGDGGDELFGGYDRYRVMRLDRYLRRMPQVMRAKLAIVGSRTSNAHPKSTSSRMRRFLKTVDQPPGKRYSSYLRLFDDATISDLICQPIRFWPDDVQSNFDDLLEHLDPVQAALATDRITYLPDDLLTKVDRASMLHALEVRSPFMDHELVQFAANLTTDQLLKGGPKRMLREAFAQDLPAWVFKRKKMGFAVPIGEWFRGELRAMLRDNLFASDSFAHQHFNVRVVQRLVDEHEQERVDHSQRLYALLMLELWWRTSRS